VLLCALSTVALGADSKPGDYRGAKKDSIPSNVWGVFTFADAQKEATKKHRALTFLVLDESVKDTALSKAQVKTFWALEDDSTLVVLRSQNAGEWHRLPEPVQKAVKAPSFGNTYPRLVASTDDGSVILGSLTKEKIVSLTDRELNKFGKELKKINATKTASTDFPPPAMEEIKPAVVADPKKDAPAPAAPASAGPVAIKDAKVEAWTNSENRAIQAALVEVNGDSVTFLINGAKVPYAISKLSPESQKRVEALKAAAAGAK
jgi:hypothetical protein